MAHITYFTFSKLCRKLEVNKAVDLELFLSKVFNDPKIFFILNKLETNYLFIYKSLLEDEDNFHINYYKKVPEKVDSESFVFEQGGKLKYHLTSDCLFIKKDFVDFNIPPEIRELGSEPVQFYREWFKNKGYADLYFNDELDLGKVVFNYNALFPRKYDVPVLNEDYKLITTKLNSNQLSIDEMFSKEEFLNELEILKHNFDRIFPCKNSRIISKFSYLQSKTDLEIDEKMTEIFSSEFVGNYGIEKFREKFQIARDLKKEIIKLILNYFKWFYKIDSKNFDDSTLENFGLICCGACKKSA